MIQVHEPDENRCYAVVTPHDPKTGWHSLPAKKFQMLLSIYGALLLRGFQKPCDEKEYAEFTQKFCDGFVRSPSPGREWNGPDRYTQAVDSGENGFRLHPEIPHKPWRPDVCWFWCKSAPKSGGETTVCSSVSFAKELRPALRKEFLKKGLLYQGEGNLSYLNQYFEASNPAMLKKKIKASGFDQIFKIQGSEFKQTWRTPAVYKIPVTGELAFGNFIVFQANKKKKGCTFGDGTKISREIEAELFSISSKMTSQVSWQKNDLLVLDNWRFMHGRNRITNLSERQILSRFGYIKEFRPGDL